MAAGVTRGKGVPSGLPLTTKLPWTGGTFELVTPGPDLEGVVISGVGLGVVPWPGSWAVPGEDSQASKLKFRENKSNQEGTPGSLPPGASGASKPELVREQGAALSPSGILGDSDQAQPPVANNLGHMKQNMLQCPGKV